MAQNALKQFDDEMKGLGETVRDVAKYLSRSEQEYQQRLQQTIGLLQERQRMEKESRAFLQNQARNSLIFNSGPTSAGGASAGSAHAPAGSISKALSSTAHGAVAKAAGGGAVGSAIGGAAVSAMGPAGVALGAVVATMEAVGAAAGKAAGAMNVLQNGSMNAAQKSDALAKQVIPGAEGLIKFRDAVNGVTESLRKINVAYAQGTLKVSQQGERLSVIDRTQVEKEHTRRRAIEMGRVVAPRMPDIDRTTAGGEIAYQQASAMLPLHAGKAQAEAESRAANVNYLQAQQRVAAQEKRMHAAETLMETRSGKSRHAVAEGNRSTTDAGQNRVQVHATGVSTLMAAQDAMQRESRLEAEILRMKEAGVTAAEKESAVRKASIAMQKQELQFLQQKEVRGTSAARRVGGMNRMEQEMGYMAAKTVEKYGYDKTPKPTRELAEHFAPLAIGKAREKASRDSDVYKRASKDKFLAEDFPDVAAARKEIPKVQTELQMKIVLDEAVLADRIAKVMDTNMKMLIKTIETKFHAQRTKQTTERVIQNSNQ